ncbi:transcription/translation regulatory transformer protein RfaH [Limnohabitans sp. Rim8]|uniref:transcription/translation regulatory transformer protein RfaH n=1 Tax=Limnohabitans sp. Rim8 TaxID=1100718 RepID=UPI00261A85D1|nr:transcription/translation regulatory transformer protein RfaH [Limnohabitans sp. Rim8]
MTPRLLTTQEAAERLGLTPGSLQELRWKDDGLPIFQNGLSVHYRLEDLEAFEQRELRTLLKQVLQRERPLPLIRAIARSLDLSVNTQGEESNPEVFKLAERQDLKPAPKVKGAAPTPTEEPVPSSPAKATAAIDLSLPPQHAWYLVHTKARQEDTAITNLQRQNFRCYMPMLHVEKVRRGKPVVVAEPMFPSYVFVQLDTSGQGQSWSPIRSTLGVRELVKFGGHPPKVDAELINTLHEREQLQQSNPQALFAAGDKVVITHGPFAGIEAIYQTTDAERRSMILLSMLNKPVSMRIEPGQLRKCG